MRRRSVPSACTVTGLTRSPQFCSARPARIPSSSATSASNAPPPAGGTHLSQPNLPNQVNFPVHSNPIKPNPSLRPTHHHFPGMMTTRATKFIAAQALHLQQHEEKLYTVEQ